MKLSDFRYYLPPELIASAPSKERELSKLMVVNRKTQTIEHKVFKDVLDYFGDGDLMVRNNTKVFPARLYGTKEKTGAKIEVFLLRELDEATCLWDVLVEPARKIRIGNKLYFGDNDILVAEVIDNTTSRGRTLRFLYDGCHKEFKKILHSLGEPPLPKEIRSKRLPTAEDKERYQTIYAKHEGAVVAPTAGMHFSRELIKRLELKGVDFAEITLHVGLGVFRKVDVEDLTKHKMDSEEFEISEDVANLVNEKKCQKKRICAIGTTTIRALETSISTTGTLKPATGWTNKFIFPPYDFNIPNSIITNFHLPESTLMMTVAAFTGYPLLMEAYKIAVKEKYNFFTYGDAMLVI